MRPIRLSILIVLAAALACDATSIQGQAPPSAARYRELRASRRAWVRELAETVTTTIGRSDTRHPIFHGNLDWHSSVHAHYALLAASRITGERRFLRIASTSLGDREKLAEEERHLANKPRFEMPYGRAWLLRLAIEDARVTRSTRLRSIADLAARSLREHYEAHPPSPDLAEYRSASWALRQLHDYYAMRRDRDGLAFVRAQVERSFLRGHPEIALEDDRRLHPEFFSRWGVWAHLLGATATRSELSGWLREHPAPALSPVRSFRNEHHEGIDFSRAFGLWTLSAELGERRFRDAAYEHLATGMERHAERRGEISYSHWVPQFGIYAIASTFETPER